MIKGKWLMVNGLQGRTRGASPEGGPLGGALLILHLLEFPFLRQSTFYNLQSKRLRKEIKYILIHKVLSDEVVH